MDATVVIPAFNAWRYIEEALDSIAGQTCLPTEVIVIDDGSSDGTGALAARHASHFPVPLRIMRQENRGISAARNAGILASSAKYIALLDADDVWLPTHLQHLTRALDASPDCVTAYCDSVRFEPTTGLEAASIARQRTLRIAKPAGDHLFLLGDEAFMSLLPGLYFSPSAAGFRRVLEGRTMLFDEGLATSEDRHLFLRLTRLGTFVFADVVTARIRRHDTNTTHRRNTLRINLNGIAALRKILDDRDGLELSQGEVNHVEAVLTEAVDDAFYTASMGGVGPLVSAFRACRGLPSPPWTRRVVHSVRAILCALPVGQHSAGQP